MSKKLNKRLKKYMKARTFPKRIAGVRIPKALRQTADTELGAALMAGVILRSVGAAAASPAGQRLTQKARQFTLLAAHALNNAAHNAGAALTGVFEEEAPKPPRRPQRRARHSLRGRLEVFARPAGKKRLGAQSHNRLLSCVPLTRTTQR